MDKALDFVRWVGLLPAAIVVGTYFAIWLFNALLPLIPNAELKPSGELAVIAQFIVGAVSFLCAALWITPHHKVKTLIALFVCAIGFFAVTIWRL